MGNIDEEEYLRTKGFGRSGTKSRKTSDPFLQFSFFRDKIFASPNRRSIRLRHSLLLLGTGEDQDKEPEKVAACVCLCGVGM